MLPVIAIEDSVGTETVIGISTIIKSVFPAVCGKQALN